MSAGPAGLGLSGLVGTVASTVATTVTNAGPKPDQTTDAQAAAAPGFAQYFQQALPQPGTPAASQDPAASRARASADRASPERAASRHRAMRASDAGQDSRHGSERADDDTPGDEREPAVPAGTTTRADDSLTASLLGQIGMAAALPARGFATQETRPQRAPAGAENTATLEAPGLQPGGDKPGSAPTGMLASQPATPAARTPATADSRADGAKLPAGFVALDSHSPEARALASDVALPAAGPREAAVNPPERSMTGAQTTVVLHAPAAGVTMAMPGQPAIPDASRMPARPTLAAPEMGVATGRPQLPGDDNRSAASRPDTASARGTRGDGPVHATTASADAPALPPGTATDGSDRQADSSGRDADARGQQTGPGLAGENTSASAGHAFHLAAGEAHPTAGPSMTEAQATAAQTSPGETAATLNAEPLAWWSAQGIQGGEMRIRDDVLDALHLRLQVSDGQAEVNIATASGASREWLNANSGQLQGLMDQSGMTLTQLSVTALAPDGNSSSAGFSAGLPGDSSGATAQGQGDGGQQRQGARHASPGTPGRDDGPARPLARRSPVIARLDEVA